MCQFVRCPCDKLRIGGFRCLRKRKALLLLALLPTSKIHQYRRNSQAQPDSRLGIADAFQRIPQKGQSGLGERAQRQSFPHLRETVSKLLELTAPVHLPSRDHLLDFGQIVRSGWSARNDTGNRLAHAVSRQGRGFEHVACRLLDISTAGIDSGHVELRSRSLPFVSDFTQVVESFLRVDATLFKKLRAQLASLFVAGRDARVEEGEELKEEWQALACAAGKIHREPDVEESLANRVEARTPILRVPVGAEVVGIGEALEKRRRLLLAHAHSRGNGGRRLLLVAHARQTFQQRALTGWQVVQSALIER